MTRKLKVRLQQFKFKSQDPSGFFKFKSQDPFEIALVFPLRKAEFTVPPPFTVGVNGFVTIVATQSLQFGAVSANTLSYFSISRRCFYRNYRCCCVFLLIFLQNGRFSISQNYDVIIRNLKNLKYQIILTFTVCLINQITSLIY